MRLAELPGVASGIKKIFFSLCYPRDTPGFPIKNVSPFGPAV